MGRESGERERVGREGGMDGERDSISRRETEKLKTNAPKPCPVENSHWWPMLCKGVTRRKSSKDDWSIKLMTPSFVRQLNSQCRIMLKCNFMDTN